MEIVVAVASKVGEYLVEATIHQVRYVFGFKCIVENLKDEVKNLIMAQDSLQQNVDRAKRNTEEIEKDVREWLTKVSNVVADVQKLEEEILENKACLKGWCTNWRWRYQLSRKAAKKRGVILKLLDNRDKLNKVSHLKPLPGIEFTAPRDFISFKATKLASDQIIDALPNEKTKMVGLYGIGGVGKTTLAKAVGNNVQVRKIFYEIVMVVVSQNPNFKHIQDQLADSLSLKLEEKSEEGRAKRLNLRFTESNSKILIILDDVWEQLDLKVKLGIPIDDVHSSCKILLTTRQKQVYTAIDCQLLIHLNILEVEEGLALLKRSAGIHDGSTFISNHEVIHEVAGECNGLPLALVTIGKTLTGKGDDEWTIVAQKLKRSKLEDVPNVGGEKGVYACHKWSYDNLKNEKIRICFLLCSLFPEDYEIPLEELVRYGVGKGLFQDVETIEDARKELLLIVDNLKDSSLLLDAGKEGFVKMHDMVRDVAIWIGYKEKKFMSKTSIGLTDFEWLMDETLEQHISLSLMESNIKVLRNGLVCPKLEILLLGESYGCQPIVVPDQFFESMKALKVVTIKNGDLSLKSLEFLTNLQCLQLIDCKLRDMTSLAKLKRLQILCLRSSLVTEIPEDLGELSKLRLLDLVVSELSQMKIISLSMIRRFSRLEEFYGEIKRWEVEGISSKSSYLSQLKFAHHMATQSFDRNVEYLPKDFAFPKLQRYNIRVNKYFSDYPCQTKALRIGDAEATSLVIFKALYQTLQYLRLDNAIGCQNIVPSVDQGGLNELTSLDLRNCQELECLVDTTQHQVPATAFSNLVELSLYQVIHLREICHGGRLAMKFLEKLEIVNIEGCGNICSLFLASPLQELQKLKEVKIKYCYRLQEVFQLERLCHSRRENLVHLSSLIKLDLENLPELKWIWKGPTQNVCLQNLEVVNVRNCDSVKYLFSPSLARSLVQLKKLTVSDCCGLAYIVMGKFDDSKEDYISFPKLKHLILEELPNLISFCSESYCPSWPNLKELKLNCCSNLASSFIAELEANVDNLVEILKSLHVECCDHLHGQIPALIRHGFNNLKDLYIGEFGVRVVFQLDSIVDIGQLSLPSLRELKLEHLPELEGLCNGPSHRLCLQI